MFIKNLGKIIAMLSMIIGIQLVGITIFVGIAQFKSPEVSAVIGNVFIYVTMWGVIFVSVKREMNTQII